MTSLMLIIATSNAGLLMLVRKEKGLGILLILEFFAN